MNKFRKKPVAVEAMQYTVESCLRIHKWMGLEHEDTNAHCDEGILIPTPEGEMNARPGDWVIRGIKGEFYPCKPDIFEATYEPVHES